MMDKNPLRTRLLPIAALAGLCLGLHGCIERDGPAGSDGGSTGGETTGGGTPDPGVCAALPAAATTYKGGDALGEELSVALDPATLAYTITVDASLQRSAGTQRSGTLVAVDGCTYESAENGARFTIGAGGVLLGGIAAPQGTAATPLLAFATSFSNADTPTVFNPVAAIYDVIGVTRSGASDTPYGGAGRIRNAGTFQLCVDTANGGFMSYDTGCANTAKGYLNYNATRGAFDLYATDPAGGASTSGGTLAGSMVIGLVDGAALPLQLLRTSASEVGLRLYAPQAALAAGSADGDYASLDSDGASGSASWSDSTFSDGSGSATLAYDTPVAGVVQASGAPAGWLLYGSGVYGFVPADGSGAALTLGLRR